LIHRVYSTHAAIQSRITDQSLEIMNESELSENMNLDDLKTVHMSKPYNRLLAAVFYKAGFIESWGRGTVQIVKECLKAGLKEPNYCLNQDYFSIVIYRTIDSGINSKVVDKVVEKVVDKVVGKVVDKLTNNQLEILKLMSEKSTISAREISQSLGISHRKTQSNIAILKEKERIQRIGASKGGYWMINDKRE
jgi:ATP-dependent DNA helicase RecG